MKAIRKLGRRSFMAKVMGGIAAGGALGLIGGEARALQPPHTGITDSDTGSNSDNAGEGRGGRHAISDNDSGPHADHAGRGRNMRGRPQPHGYTDGDASDPRGGGHVGYTGYSDTDGSDRSGHGRQGRNYTGYTNSDSYDRPGYGRNIRHTMSDGDSGPSADWSGQARHARREVPCTDSDFLPPRDPRGHGRHC